MKGRIIILTILFMAVMLFSQNAFEVRALIENTTGNPAGEWNLRTYLDSEGTDPQSTALSLAQEGSWLSNPDEIADSHGAEGALTSGSLYVNPLLSQETYSMSSFEFSLNGEESAAHTAISELYLSVYYEVENIVPFELPLYWRIDTDLLISELSGAAGEDIVSGYIRFYDEGMNLLYEADLSGDVSGISEEEIGTVGYVEGGEDKNFTLEMSVQVAADHLSQGISGTPCSGSLSTQAPLKVSFSEHELTSGVVPLGMIAEFTQSGRVGVAPYTVQFTDLSIGEEINIWSWDFDGDGTEDSNAQHPEYTYNNPGTYSVELEIDNATEIPATITKKYYILVKDAEFEPGTMVFDVRGMEAGPPSEHWSFDIDGTPFVHDSGGGEDAGVYAFQQFNWNEDRHGDGSFGGNPDPPATGPGSGVLTTMSTIYSNVVLATDINSIGLEFSGFDLAFFEHINTVNPGQPWDTMGEAGDHRIYEGGYATLYYAGTPVIVFDDITLDVEVHYPAPLGDGGAVGFGIMHGESQIDIENSNQSWVDEMDPYNTGMMQFNCNTADPVNQNYYGTYDMPVILLEPMGEPLPEIGWGNLQWPLQTVTTVGVPTENIFGQVWIDGLTNEPGATAGLVAQVGFGAAGSDPAGWNWTNAVFNQDVGNNDEYMGQLIVNEAGIYEYTYRYSYQGREWYYAEERGALTVNAGQEFAEVIFVVDMAWQELAGNFNTQSDFVDVAGNFNEWNGSGAMLDMGNGWYEYTIELEVGYTCEYKYRINGSWDTAELPDQGNRTLEVPAGGTVVNEVYDNWTPEISWVDLISPLSLTVPMNQQSEPVYGQVFIDGLTNGAGAAPLVEAQVGYGTGLPDGWNWQTAMYQQEAGNNDEYAGTFSCSTAGNYEFGYRFRFNLGQWHYGNTNGTLTILSDEMPELIINEINAVSDEGSIGADEDYEFIELYNPGMVAVDLSGCSIAGSVTYEFADYAIIESEDYIVIARNPDELSTAYGLDNVVGPFSGELPDITGTVILQTAMQEIIDEVDYDTSWYFASEYGWGSLELRNPELDNSEEESWCASYGSGWDENLMHYGGTPGVINLHYYTIYDIQYPGSMHSEKQHEMVECTGIITAKFFGNNVQRYAMQVPEFLMNTYDYSGIFVYASEWLDFEQGDIITVTGLVTEDGGGNSDTVLDPWNIALQSSGNQLPEPVYIELIAADAMTDDWEGVLITTSGNCSTYNANGGYWALTDGLWSAWIAGVSDQHYSVPAGAIQVGNDYTVRGIIEGYDIWMRSEDDWNEGLYTLPGYITGTVTSANTGNGIEGAQITAAYPEWRTEYTATTDSDGYYEMEVPVGIYHVTCVAVGYEEPDYEIAIVNEEETEVIDFVLEVGNLPPVLNLPGVFGFNEDETLAIDINDYATDPENDPLTAWVEGNENIQVQAMGSELTFSAPANWNGMETVTFYVSDEANRSVVSAEQDIEVYPVNDAPWLELPEELTINIATDEIPYVFDIELLCYDVDGDQLWVDAIHDPELDVMINGLVLEITPAAGFTGSTELTVTVYDNELQAVDMVIVNVIDEAGNAELVFDIFGLEAGPAGINWMFDADMTPFDFDGNENSNYAYQAFNWNADGHGDGSCLSGGSGVVTDQTGVSENLPFVDNADDLGVYINGYTLTFFEHINTENPEQPWDTMGEAGDHRQYTGGIGEISHNGEVVLYVNDVLYDMKVYYPAPIGNGGAMGYGTVDGEGIIDVENSDPQWVEHFDPDGTGLIYFYCGSMSPVLQDCYGTYDVDDLVIYGVEAGNQPPILSLPYQFTFDEDSSLQIDLNDYAFDADGDELSVFVENNQNINTEIEGTLLTLSAPADWNGMEIITIGVDDGQSRAIATAEVEIVVIPVNDAPWIDLPEEITIDAEIDPLPYEFDVSPYCGDIDSENLILGASNSPDISVTIDGLLVYIDLVEMQSTLASLTVTVYDEAFLNSSDTMNVNIIAENPMTTINGWVTDENTMMPIENVEIILTESPVRRMSRQEMVNRPSYTVYTDPGGYYELELDPGFYDLNATHPDYEAVFAGNIEVIEFTSMEYSFTMMPASTGYVTTGLYTVGCEYGDGFVDFVLGDLVNIDSGCSTDAIGYGDFTEMTETVYAGENVDLSMQSDYSSNYARIWVDFDQDFAFSEDELILESTQLYQNVPVDVTITIPEYALPGEYRMRARTVWNNQDFTASTQYDYGEVEDYTLLVGGTPELTIDLPDGGVSFDEDTVFNLDLADYVTGIYNELTWDGNENIDISVTGSVLSFTPEENWYGTETVTITITDSVRTIVSDDLTLTVNPVNDAPILALPPEITINLSYDDLPYLFDIEPLCDDVDDDQLWADAMYDPDIYVIINELVLEITPMAGFTGSAELSVTVNDGELQAVDLMIVNVIDEPGTAEMVFDIFGLEAGPAFGNWMFDADGTPFIEDGGMASNYAYQAFSWNIDGHGDGSCESGGSGVITEQMGVAESLPFVADPSELQIYINDFSLTLFEHINTENPENPWNTMGEAGDHRQYTGGIGEISHNGEVVLSVTNVLYDMIVYYPNPIGNGGAMGYGTVEGEGIIDVGNSEAQWVEYFDPDGTGIIYFSCGSMSPVLQDCYGTYDVDDLVVYGMQQQQNQPPQIDLPDMFVFDEDSMLMIDLNDYAFDPDNNPLTVSIVNNYFVNIEIDGMIITFTAQENWNGTELITISVNDNQTRAIASDDVEVMVIPINDAPWIDLPEEITINSEIDQLPYEFYISPYYGDIDSQNLTLEITNSPEIEVSTDGVFLYIDIIEMQSTLANISVTVYDEELLSAMDYMNVNIITPPLTVIYGWVSDEETFTPIENAEITLMEVPARRLTREEMINRTNYTVYTDSEGYYETELDAGYYDLQAYHPDFEAFFAANILVEENSSLEYSFTMLPISTGYVTTGLYQTGCSMGDGFTGFSFADLENLASGCSNDDIGYGDFTYLTANVTAGEEVEVVMQSGYSSNYARIWVDFDQDYNFSEDELIMESTALIQNEDVTVPVIIPESIMPGEYRMRARAVWNDDQFTPSGQYLFGEVEDYTLSVSEAPELTIDLPDEGITFDEDGFATLDLVEYTTGEDYTVSWSGNEFINISLEGTIINFTPDADWFGSETITIAICDDSGRFTASDEIIITVSPVNDAPYIDMPTQLSFYTYGPKVRDISSCFGDVDNDELTVTVTGNDSIGVEVIGSIIHLLIDDGWTGTDTWTITVDDGVTRETASDIVNIQVGDVLIINLDNVLPAEDWGTGCFDFSEDGAELSVIPPAGEGWECSGLNDPSWYYYPGELSLTPGRLYVNLDYFDLHWFQVDVTLTDYCGIGCTEVTATMGQNTFMTNYNTESYVETHVTIVNGMGNDYDGFYISTLEGTVHEIHVYFADQNPTYIGGHITDSGTDLPLEGVEITVADVFDTTMVYTTGTGADGNYYVEVEPSTYDITYECEGYESVYYYDVTLAEGDFVDYSFAMVPETVEITLIRDLAAGWNWISLNLECEDMEINAILNSLGENGISIKNQSSTALYYTGIGWVGSLNAFDHSSLYKMQMADSDVWEITGTPALPSEYPLELSAGWNWISFLPQEAVEINTALASISESGLNIKNSSQFATCYPGAGWFGTLEYLYPLYGYMLEMLNPAVLVYPDEVVRNEVKAASREETGQPQSRWTINHHDFEFNGSVIAHIEGMEQGDQIAVFAQDECRGSGAVLDYSEHFGHLTFVMMAYTSFADGEELCFRYYDQSEDKEYRLSEKLFFTPDAVIGGFDEPLQLTIPADDDSDIAFASGLGKCVPNPFNPTGTIYYSLAEDSQVEISIFNIRGQKVKTLISDQKPAGEYHINWNGKDDAGITAASGLYFVKMNSGDYQAIGKIILLK